MAAMQPFSNIGDVTHVIQLAVAPVFLLTALGTLINVLISRLGRTVDRRRALERFLHGLSMGALAKGAAASAQSTGAEENRQADTARSELATVERRIRLVYIAIVLAVLAALFICMLVALAFIDAFVQASLAAALGVLFILAMVAMVACLLVFLREIFLAVNAEHSVVH